MENASVAETDFNSATPRVTIEQGIWGDVSFWEGGVMPPCPSGTVTAVYREPRIHELTSLDQVVQGESHPAFYSAVNNELVAPTSSDESTFFEVELEVGTYSVFAIEDLLYSANGLDGHSNIWQIEVAGGEVTCTQRLVHSFLTQQLACLWGAR